jgi:potassium-transporting ATPase KdpC subunit
MASLAQLGAAVRAMVVLTALLGLAYPLTMTGIGQVFFRANADGSLVIRDGQPVGSSLIGQSFMRQTGTDQEGNPIMEPDPAYFQARPSAAGAGYDPLASSASNLGPENKDLLAAIADRRTAAVELDGTASDEVAPDALLASGSGLDPHISPEYADQQVTRVAGERPLSMQQVRELVDEHTRGRTLGFLGEPRVNVLELNLALDRLVEASD